MWHIVLVSLLGVTPCSGHGAVTWPPSRVGAQKKLGGACDNGACMWFSQVAEIPGEPTLPQKFRTVNVNINGGPHDVTRKNPWRAPGSAPVHGSGCGVAGAGSHGTGIEGTGADVPPGAVFGQDGASLPRLDPVVWRAGSIQEVAWSINANHNGGYSWRLCKNDAPRKDEVSKVSTSLPTCVADPTCKTSTCRKCSSNVSWSCDECCDGCSKESKGHTGPILGGFVCSCSMKNGTSPPEPVSPDVNEACFQKNQLKFATTSSWIEWPNGSRLEFPLTKVTEGTYPAGSEWARNPIPSCHICDRYDKCGPGIEPNGTHDEAYARKAWCSGYCNGQGQQDADGFSTCPPGTESYPAPAGISGYGMSGSSGVVHGQVASKPWPWNIVDKVEVPKHLPSGDYLLSWRWDCEQSSQVWQNCADVRIQGGDVVV